MDGYILDGSDQKVTEASTHFIAVKSDHEINDADLYSEMYTLDEDIPDTIVF